MVVMFTIGTSYATASFRLRLKYDKLTFFISSHRKLVAGKFPRALFAVLALRGKERLLCESISSVPGERISCWRSCCLIHEYKSFLRENTRFNFVWYWQLWLRQNDSSFCIWKELNIRVNLAFPREAEIPECNFRFLRLLSMIWGESWISRWAQKAFVKQNDVSFCRQKKSWKVDAAFPIGCCDSSRRHHSR